MPSPLRLGLTGGIGSGKSSVARLLADRGAALVDADAIAREVTAPAGPAMPLIAEVFGQDFMTPDGALDRDKMRGLIHTDPMSRQRLESIIHPLVALETQRQSLIAIREGCPCIVFDIPLLVESPTWRQTVHQVLVVDCTPEAQISRVMARDHLTRTEVEKVMASQASRELRLGAADMVLFNVGLSFEELTDEVRQIACRFGLSCG